MMAAKKQPGRFTIQFSPADSQQRQVIELLNLQGRRKAAFITSAVLSYCGQNVAPPPVSVPQMDLTAIEQVVRKVLQEHPEQISQPMAEPRNSPPPISPKEVPPAENPLKETELPEDVLGAISDMIDAFRG